MDVMLGTAPVEAPAAPVEVVTPMRPSMAMRLGRMLYPAGTLGRMARWDGRSYAVCALGAMEAGYGWRPRASHRELSRAWDSASGRLRRDDAPCPADYCDGLLDAFTLVFHLNDGHDWSTARIADHLESLGL